MNERVTPNTHTFSVKSIYHFNCCNCGQWWSIADFDLNRCKRRHIDNGIVAFCPVCCHYAELVPVRAIDRLLSAFKIGDRVRKKSGAEWQGRVCGQYSTDLTPEGYAVESSVHKNSVQIYPANALELASLEN